MKLFRYTISDEIFAAHPGYCRGLIVLSNANNDVDDTESSALLRQSEERLRGSFSGNPAEHPRIAAWRDAYKKFGAKPSEHRSSIEAMVRRVVKPDSLPSINALVNIGNCVSLRHLLPVDVHPYSIESAVYDLRRAMSGDVFHPVDGTPDELPLENEIVFTSGNEVLTRRWTWRQAAGTQTTKEMRNVFFNFDGLAPCQRSEVDIAMNDVIEMVEKYCGASILFRGILDQENSMIEVPLGM